MKRNLTKINKINRKAKRLKRIANELEEGTKKGLAMALWIKWKAQLALLWELFRLVIASVGASAVTAAWYFTQVNPGFFSDTIPEQAPAPPVESAPTPSANTSKVEVKASEAEVNKVVARKLAEGGAQLTLGEMKAVKQLASRSMNKIRLIRMLQVSKK
jgi:hypothetical protein